MVALSREEPTTRSATLARALKAVRRRRGLRSAEVAAAMGMPLRSYEHFEGGHGRLNLEPIRDFAAATDSDPFAILAAEILEVPELAVQCMDNKLMVVLLGLLEDFAGRAGGGIARLDPATLLLVFGRAFESLEMEAIDRQAFLEKWLRRRPPEGDGGAPHG